MRPSPTLKLLASSLASYSSRPIQVHTKPPLLFSNSLRFPGYSYRNDLLVNMRTTRSATRKAAATVSGDTTVTPEETAVAVVTKTNGKIDAPEAAELTTDLQVITQAVAQGTFRYCKKPYSASN